MLALCVVFPGAIFPGSALFRVVCFAPPLFRAAGALVFGSLCFGYFFNVPFTVLFMRRVAN